MAILTPNKQIRLIHFQINKKADSLAKSRAAQKSFHLAAPTVINCKLFQHLFSKEVSCCSAYGYQLQAFSAPLLKRGFMLQRLRLSTASIFSTSSQKRFHVAAPTVINCKLFQHLFDMLFLAFLSFKFMFKPYNLAPMMGLMGFFLHAHIERFSMSPTKHQPKSGFLPLFVIKVIRKLISKQTT